MSDGRRGSYFNYQQHLAIIRTFIAITSLCASYVCLSARLGFYVSGAGRASWLPRRGCGRRRGRVRVWPPLCAGGDKTRNFFWQNHSLSGGSNRFHKVLLQEISKVLRQLKKYKNYWTIFCWMNWTLCLTTNTKTALHYHLWCNHTTKGERLL